MGKFSNILRLTAWVALMMLGGCGTDDPVKGGALDRSFNASNGYAILQSIAGVSTGGVETAVQPDGRIVVAGRRSGPLGDDVLVARYTADGLLDASFGGGGIVTFNGSGVGNDRALGLALQPDGKILVAGYATVTGSPKRDILVLRFTASGELDPAFGDAGVFVYNGSGNGTDIAFAVALQPDGKILVAGESATALSQDALILRLLPNGTLDTSFAGQGVFLFNGQAGGLDRFFDVKVQADGKVLAAGSTSGVAGVDVLLVRLDPGGALDASFGAGGAVRLRGPSAQDGYANSLSVQPDGRLVVTGTLGKSGTFDLFAARFLPGGQLDTGFGTGGYFVYDAPSDGDDYGYASSILGNGSILIAGTSGNGPVTETVVLRLTSDGLPDGGFGQAGAARYSLNSAAETTGYGMALQQDGRIIVTGNTISSGIERLFVMRLLP